MKSLVLDTLFENLSLGLLEDHEVRALLYTHCRRRNAKIVLAQLQELLRNLNWDLENLDELIVNRGPGSYTGVRIALSVVRTIAQVLKLPIRCVTSLEVMAFQVSPRLKPFPVMLNCTRQEVFWAWFEFNEKGVPEMTSEIELVVLKDLPNAVLESPAHILQLGQRRDPELNKLEKLFLHYPVPDAWMIHQAVHLGQVKALPIEQVQPLYIKKDVQTKSLIR
ncbi:MAG: tRNA (adenosine(37)-N6)-threonylcarbamoyltransferase complex dimerization subunit type 1 TsaB [SAR324 cluster bacterium]|uniref:tRNA (Adenosine(37)-N6)-threonylcarbamoyltransferase complex dimerization subunit type 1 TsaB n=1 Tax=SAR324 cluster bacterium TaxID=2024889 RepID=A0A2D6YK79_9DELT|nr:tRNA (adenosine(37)-N6)-threonylcarbamoyltransferase complex dimerization subunit type 1 TsaB [SAR324 cluster bacterium]